MNEGASHEALCDTDEGRTIFLRNVPFEMTEFALKELIERKFGETLYVKLVFSKTTQLPKGVAFIKFKNIESVEKVLEGENAAEKYYNEHIFQRRGDYSGSKNSNTLVLPPEVGIQYNGRRIFAHLALSRSEVAAVENKKASKNQLPKVKKDLELLKKGLLLPGMKGTEGISSHDLRLRENSWKEIKIKMNNPNYEVNKFRLCVRNIPTKMKSCELNNVIIQEISKLDDNKVYNLAKEIISEIDESENSDCGNVTGLRRISKALKRNINSPKRCRSIFRMLIKKVNIIRENSLKTSKSRGFAFVNTISHSFSSTLLEILNNNPKAFTYEKRPIVEFAIDDKRALFIQRKRIKKNFNKCKDRNSNSMDNIQKKAINAI
ncbi:nucleolar protein NOP4 and rrm domain-containing protein [Cryptosporidium canis]|uniref:Nucleolar protein NOP4 and rrm domain-containing protein n=1 Tax=Cryptosporidium canis TaxID=195482 RepID=A0ABQ8P7R1_9CRYT|nr:nucleolar protein NOP4 and rrm domain-containing protein [Cryptosporidium canis]KAJ1613926.1 nucleolar protein NOP4 and rrm domain-containing protein [Cryptosporidium canis]